MPANPGEPRPRRLALDPQAESATSDRPAFFTPPPGAPVYYGFPLVPEAVIDGFQLGMITDFLGEPDSTGDAYVVAPDGSRAGLVWESDTEPYFNEVLAPTDNRWGVWAVGLPLPMTTRDEARSYLAGLLPELRPRWEAWVRKRT
jgi:hypothetical protein